MLIQGAFELFAAIALSAATVMMGHVMSHGEFPRQPPGGPSPGQMFWMVIVIYGGMALVALLAAILHIIAGMQNWRFRGRTLGIVALACGILMVFTCWCLPTAAGLCVYGLIVYLNQSVSEAFRMGQAGCASSEIFNTFQL